MLRVKQSQVCLQRAKLQGLVAVATGGYNALEGTFLGGCIFSGRQAGRADTIA